MPRKINEVGNRYGRLTVLRESVDTFKGVVKWTCLCDCGSTKSIDGPSLRKGATRSCGCLRREFRRTHGLSDSKLYHIWDAMVQRCTNTNSKHYYNYGARGITVCEEWRRPEHFLTWALANGYGEGLDIDREDNEKGYSPDNCRFVTRSVNNTNRRRLQNATGYTGLSETPHGKYASRLKYRRVQHNIGNYDTKEEAVRARNQFIMDNRLPHKIQEIKCDSCS